VHNDALIGEEGRDQLLPHIRRVLLEQKLKEIALDSGLRAEVECVNSGAHKYVAVRSGRLVLTASKTTGRNAIPRACAFREQYSDVNEHIDQQNLFPGISEPADAALYGIIIHGPNERHKKELAFCCFGFPSPDMEKWAQEPIALADVCDYQQQRYQKTEDGRAEIQSAEPKLKPQYEADKMAEKSA
jgi:hypothetical protein